MKPKKIKATYRNGVIEPLDKLNLIAITYTLVLLCKCVKFVLTEAQANSLCYKCAYIFGFYYKASTSAKCIKTNRREKKHEITSHSHATRGFCTSHVTFITSH